MKTFLTEKKNMIGWTTIVLTFLVGILLLMGIQSLGPVFEYTSMIIVFVWFITVLVCGVTQIFLDQQLAEIATILFFPIVIFVTPHFFGLADSTAGYFNVARHVFQFAIPICTAGFLIFIGKGVRSSASRGRASPRGATFWLFSSSIVIYQLNIYSCTLCARSL